MSRLGDSANIKVIFAFHIMRVTGHHLAQILSPKTIHWTLEKPFKAFILAKICSVVRTSQRSRKTGFAKPRNKHSFPTINTRPLEQ